MTGSRFWPEGRATDALTRLQQAFRAASERPQGLNNYGAALQAEGRTGAAIEQFRRAVELQAAYFNARYNLANAPLAQIALSEAAANRRLLLPGVPADQAARRQLSAALLRMGTEALSAGTGSTRRMPICGTISECS